MDQRVEDTHTKYLFICLNSIPRQRSESSRLRIQHHCSSVEWADISYFFMCLLSSPNYEWEQWTPRAPLGHFFFFRGGKNEWTERIKKRRNVESEMIVLERTSPANRFGKTNWRSRSSHGPKEKKNMRRTRELLVMCVCVCVCLEALDT